MMVIETDEIVAAGGLVLQPAGSDPPKSGPEGTTAADSRKVLLVHRPKYDDWSFPKGKADPGESIEQTALREVREETGFHCRIIKPLSDVRYTYEGGGVPRPKVVHYFLMEPASGALALNGYEIDLAEWLAPADAIRRLSYDHDRKLLRDLLQAGVV